MPIHIYNSLTRKKEEFIPQNPPAVNIYTCGVTVYDESHIGHARSLYIFDIIRRYLKYRGFVVKFVRNITDIDDKIINRARELKIGWQELVDKYIARYYEDLNALGIKKADYEPRATENIEDMIKHIQGLIDKGFAYESGGDVYFNVRKIPNYGKLSGQSIDQMEKGVRIEPSEFKKDYLDFALWKKSKPDEPSWPSRWSKGRPGWHIECSVMSQKFLKTETLDIHAGGRDLIFPHHENEIAQAEALTGKLFAKYWIHHGLLTINGQKMAKSAGNFVTIKDFMEKYKDADLLKLFFLSAHYSHPIDYNEKKIGETKQALERISILMDKIEKLSLRGGAKGFLACHCEEPRRGDEAISRQARNRLRNPKEIASPLASLGARNDRELDELKNKFIESMDDDFNMPQGLSYVFELVNLANKNIDNQDFLISANALLGELFGIFGIALERKAQPAGISDEEIKEKIKDRNRARENKDYALSDKIRKELEQKGVILEDTKEGTTWRRKL